MCVFFQVRFLDSFSNPIERKTDFQIGFPFV